MTLWHFDTCRWLGYSSHSFIRLFTYLKERSVVRTRAQSLEDRQLSAWIIAMFAPQLEHGRARVIDIRTRNGLGNINHHLTKIGSTCSGQKVRARNLVEKYYDTCQRCQNSTSTYTNVNVQVSNSTFSQGFIVLLSEFNRADETVLFSVPRAQHNSATRSPT